MLEISMALIAAALLVCLVDLRLGMYLSLAIGFLQEVLRKSIPDEPVWLTGLVAAFAAATLIGAWGKRQLVQFREIPEWNREMRAVTTTFALLVVLQSISGTLKVGSLVVGVIGLLVYLSPLPAFLMAYTYGASFQRAHAFLWTYVILCAGAAAGVYLSWAGVSWDLLRSIGEPLIVYSRESGEAIELPSGFMRAPEVMAWHAASGCCIALILGAAARRPATGWISGLLSIFFLGAIVLTGRRKFLIEIAIFLPLFYVLLIHFRVGATRIVWTIGAITTIGLLLAVGKVLTEDTVVIAGEATLRAGGQHFGEDLTDRIQGVGLSLYYVIAANGFLGSGAGSGSQGSQHFGGGEEVVGLAAEGGFGKVLAELGVPGFILFLFLLFKFLKYSWRTLHMLAGVRGQQSSMGLGLAAFLAANGIVFASAHQVYGDLYVLFVLGCCVGFVTATRATADVQDLGLPPAAEHFQQAHHLRLR